ncbi:MAG: Na+/H+ antiporter NhaC family protein [Candidatus Eisenbacteria bacterium]
MTGLRVAVLLVFALLLLFAPDPDPEYLFERSVGDLAKKVASTLDGTPREIVVEVVGGDGAGAPRVRSLLAAAGLEVGGDGPPLRLVIRRGDGSISASWNGEGRDRTAKIPFVDARALLPPFVAILTALIFQRTILALFSGVWLGTTLMNGNNPILGLWVFFRTYLVQEALLDSFRIEIIGFVIGLVALVGIMSRGGGVQGMIQLMMRFVRSRRSAQAVTFAMGLVIFFDDYANTILVGSTMRPLTDRFRISREKLSYLVDSTAAPVAGLSLLSTWIAYEVSQFAPQLLEVGIAENPYIVFARTLPYRFYSVFTLVFIGTGIFLGREFGPMLRAEKRACREGHVIRPGARPMISDAMTRVKPKEGVPFRWWNGLLPLGAVVAVTLAALWITGNRSLEAPYGLRGLFSVAALREVIAGANSTRAIAAGAWSGFFLAAALLLAQRILGAGEIVRAAFSSTRALFFAIVILLFAWCIGGVCRDMGTAHYLVALFRETLSPLLYPMILFVLSCLVSFSTGSSWSTMAIILPNSVVLAYLLGESSPVGPFGLTVLSIGAVLEGSIFGDHCSPISDTTILSSVSSAADHIDHVRTQIPYALATATIALAAGYVPAARGAPAGSGLLVGAVLIVLLVRLAGKRPEREDQPST